MRDLRLLRVDTIGARNSLNIMTLKSKPISTCSDGEHLTPDELMSRFDELLRQRVLEPDPMVSQPQMPYRTNRSHGGKSHTGNTRNPLAGHRTKSNSSSVLHAGLTSASAICRLATDTKPASNNGRNHNKGRLCSESLANTRTSYVRGRYCEKISRCDHIKCPGSWWL